MNTHYTNERNAQILIYLMKQHGVRKVVASPGATNIVFLASLQQDPYFEIYSVVDERSAAYIACGLAEESGEQVAISCTGATASRNYVPGLTEAFYRKLPILAITATQHVGRIGHHIPQVIDRSVLQNDIAKLSIHAPAINSEEDEWACTVDINKALLELTHNGKGPVHINLATTYSKDFSVQELPKARVIRRVNAFDIFPELHGGKIGIFVGAHSKWSDRLQSAVDAFCEKYNAVVFCDHSSNYKGKYGVFPALVCAQQNTSFEYKKLDTLIHIGDISGGYLSIMAKEVWRVNPDGEVRDAFRALSYVFEMEEVRFFEKISNKSVRVDQAVDYYKLWQEARQRLLTQFPNVPFSNIWIAQKTAHLLPENCVLHLGILNTLRSWNFFEIPSSVMSYANTGGFGIDGCVSSLIGASFANQSKLYFGIVGDLAFFYDMNVIGNRHIGNNLRLMIVNNGKGAEFRNYNHPAARFGEEADLYMAAGGHYGNQSPQLIRNYAEDLGFEYVAATSKEEYLQQVNQFVNPIITDKPMVFEVFTNHQDESDALEMVNTMTASVQGTAKSVATKILGENGKQRVKKLLRRS